MNAAYIHLLFNHFPIIGSLFGFCFFIFGVFFKNSSIKNAGLIIFLVISIITIPAYFSGEGTEDYVENIPGIVNGIIHDHEELAEIAFLMMSGLGLLSAIALIPFKNKAYRGYLTFLISLLSLITVITMIIVGSAGGKIRHTELYGGEKVSKYLDISPDDKDDH